MQAMLLSRWMWAVLALPALSIALQAIRTSGEMHWVHTLLEPSGEASARLLIVALCATPLSMLLPRWRGTRILLRHRRAIGVASFLYGCLHLVLYVASVDALSTVLAQFGWTYILLGWLAFVAMVPLALTSTNASMRRLGKNWKRLHRLAYLAAVATYLHWVAIYGVSILVNVTLNFLPVILLTGYRIWCGWWVRRQARATR